MLLLDGHSTRALPYWLQVYFSFAIECDIVDNFVARYYFRFTDMKRHHWSSITSLGSLDRYRRSIIDHFSFQLCQLYQMSLGFCSWFTEGISRRIKCVTRTLHYALYTQEDISRIFSSGFWKLHQMDSRCSLVLPQVYHSALPDICRQLVVEHKGLEGEGQRVQLHVMLPHHPGRQAR